MERGICFEGSLLDLFKGSQRKGYQSEKKDIEVFLLPVRTELKYILIFFSQMV